MRNLLTASALTLTLALLVPAGVQAQQSDNDKGGTTGMMTTTPRDASDDAAGTRGTEVTAPANTVRSTVAEEGSLATMRGEQIVGQTLYGANGEEIGEVEDVVARQGSTSPELLVSVGGFLGIGERHVTIPADQVRMQGDRLVTSMSKESIGALQPHEQSGWESWDRNRTMSGG